jgi:hypothetical protein
MRAPLAVALAVALLGAGCGASSDVVRGTGALSWTQRPRTVALGSRPNDRILFGVVRNDSLRPVRVNATDIRVLDRGGRRLSSVAVFARSFAHGLYGSTDPRAREPGEFELTRLGRLVRLKPGETAPLTVSWRLAGGATTPEQLDYGRGALPIP